jgi:hypothetical protein
MPKPKRAYDAQYVRDHILARVGVEDRGHTTACWIWQQGINGAGYGTARPAGCQHGLAHRIAYEAFVGPIPAGLTIDHLCRVRPCCNPAHLEAVTQRENNARGGVGWASGTRGGPGRSTQDYCRRGHELTPDNVILWKAGRRCRACNLAWRAEHDSERASWRARKSKERRRARNSGGRGGPNNADAPVQVMSLAHDGAAQ